MTAIIDEMRKMLGEETTIIMVNNDTPAMEVVAEPDIYDIVLEALSDIQIYGSLGRSQACADDAKAAFDKITAIRAKHAAKDQKV